MLPQLTVLSVNEKPDTVMTRVVLDGYSEEIDPELCRILRSVIHNEQDVFFSDSFKFITRNFNKLINVLEFLLTHNVCFVTPNFYIENGCVERRTNLLKASHSAEEMLFKLTQTSGLNYKHRLLRLS